MSTTERPLGRLQPTDDRHLQRWSLTPDTIPAKPTPVVLGIAWYSSFDHPTRTHIGAANWIGRGDFGRVRGGHAICIKPPEVYDANSWWSFYDQGVEGQCVGHSLSRAMSLLNRMRYDAPWLYHEAQKIDEWPGECVDTETECLSSRGWIRHDELTIGDEILVFDMETEHTRWATVEKVHRYAEAPYRVWSHNQIEVAVTDNHKWVVSNRLTTGGWELVPTTQLKSQHTMPRSFPAIDQNHLPVVHDDEVRLVAWAITEGHYRPEHRRGNSVEISQKSHRSAVTELMTRLGVARGYEKEDGCHAWSVNGQLATMVREAAPNKAPTISWLRQLTQRQLRLFIDTCVLADGSVTDGTKWSRLDRQSFHQKPGPILDAFLAACALAGIPTTRASEAGPDRPTETWSLRQSNLTEVRKIEPSDVMLGPVWCPQTPYGTFVARRGGSIFITGNSYSGTSVRAGCDVLRGVGHSSVRMNVGQPTLIKHGISANRWARDVEDVASCLQPRDGGRAILNSGYVTLMNSWGRSYPHYVRLPLESLRRLLEEDGEATVLQDL